MSAGGIINVEAMQGSTSQVLSGGGFETNDFKKWFMIQSWTYFLVVELRGLNHVFNQECTRV